MAWEKQPWPNLKYCSSISLKGFEEIQENLSQTRLSPGRDFVISYIKRGATHSNATFGECVEIYLHSTIMA
jgi:hypothetical protein